MPFRATDPANTEWWWIFDPRRSLRARVALLVGAGTLVFSALLTWLVGGTYRRTLQAQTTAALETLAFQLADKLDRTIYERYRTLTLAASLPALRNPAASPTDRRRVLDAMQESTADFAWIGFADRSGHIDAATGGLFENASAKFRGWFPGARNSAYVGPLRLIPELSRNASATIDADSAPRFFDLAIPLTDTDGQFHGVLAAHIRWTLAREVQLSVVPESLAREHIGATVYAGGEVLLDSGASGWTQPPDPPEISDPRRTRGSFVEQNPLGTAYVTGFARSRGYREYRGVGWLVVVRQPVAHAFASVASLRRTVGAWAFSLSLVAMGASWLLVSRHAWRLRSVRASAERIHEGDILTVLPRPPGDSELAKMCGALGDLVEDLRSKKPPKNDNPM
ncbi:MAG: cache domain-containing protein [Verrucomicrobiota bacterium]